MNFEQTTAEAANDDRFSLQNSMVWFFVSSIRRSSTRAPATLAVNFCGWGSVLFRGKLVGLGDNPPPPPKKTEIPHVSWNVSILRFELWEWRFVVDSFSCQLITDQHLQLGCSSVLHISNMCPEELCFLPSKCREVRIYLILDRIIRLRFPEVFVSPFCARKRCDFQTTWDDTMEVNQ